jgi:hypothetical protein
LPAKTFLHEVLCVEELVGMHRCLFWWFASLEIVLVASSTTSAQQLAKPVSSAPLSFIRDIAPIFRENCFACHDSKKRKGKLDLTTYAGLRRGGFHEDVVVPGRPEESRLLQRLRGQGKERMPPPDAGEALPPEQIEQIARWVQQGAVLDAGLDPQADLRRELRRRWEPPLPPEVYARPALINALIFTPDGRKLVVGGHQELVIGDVTTGKWERRLAVRAERVYALAFLPDGRLVLAGGRPGQEGEVALYDLAAGRPRPFGGLPLVDGVHDPAVRLQQLADSEDVFFALAVSREGQKLAAAGCDRQVRVWEVGPRNQPPRLLQTFEDHADWVFGLAFAPDGRRLATASRDKTVKLWDLTAQETVLTFSEHQQPVYAVCFTADGQAALSAGEDGNVRYWHVAGDAKTLGKQFRVTGGHTKAITQMVYRAAGSEALLATCSQDGTVRLWDPNRGQPRRTLEGDGTPLYALALSPDGSLIAAAGLAGEVRLWRLRDGQLQQRLILGPARAAPLAVQSKK